MQRETSIVYVTLYHMMYFNPLPLCRGRHNHLVFLQQRFLISILSLYTEGDERLSLICTAISAISILSLYTEGDLLMPQLPEIVKNFNPLPLYRGRPDVNAAHVICKIISILSLYTEGDNGELAGCTTEAISILSLYTEGDPTTFRIQQIRMYFNPLPLYRGRL